MKGGVGEATVSGARGLLTIGGDEIAGVAGHAGEGAWGHRDVKESDEVWVGCHRHSCTQEDLKASRYKVTGVAGHAGEGASPPVPVAIPTLPATLLLSSAHSLSNP